MKFDGSQWKETITLETKFCNYKNFKNKHFKKCNFKQY